jgi:hypothetical protein
MRFLKSPIRAVGVAAAADGAYVLFKLVNPDGSPLPDKFDNLEPTNFAYVEGIYGRNGETLYEYVEPGRGHGPLL